MDQYIEAGQVELQNYRAYANESLRKLELDEFSLVLATFVTLCAISVLTDWISALARKGPKAVIVGAVFGLLKAMPWTKAFIDAENAKMKKKMKEMLIPESDDVVYKSLPEEGIPKDELMEILTEWSERENPKWNTGQVSGAVYHGGEELTDLIADTYRLFALTNPLHPDLFPQVRKMEAEVVRMALTMYNGDEETCGTTTSGGTESILMAMKAYRDRALATKGIRNPNIVVPVTAHAAFDKAAHYFNIDIVHVDVDPNTRRARVGAMKRAVNRNTICIVGSAPSFPQGCIDPIEELAAFARSKGIGMHVDCCLGSFIVPFLSELGYDVPIFDFRLPGVTTISCDPHKYGFAPKGSSLIMYRNSDYRRYQYFVAPNWPGGIYACPSVAGSRPGALVAATWATMVHMGRQGYRNSASLIVATAKEIERGIREMDKVYVLGEPDSTVVSIASKELNIFNVGDVMSSKGWNLNSLQFPASLHICCTLLHTGSSAQRFLDDLADAVDEVANAPPGKFKDSMGAIYGMAESIPDRTMVDDIARNFIDVLYMT